MKRILSVLAAAGLVAAAAPSLAADRAARGEAGLAKLLANRVPGKPVSCINQRDIRSSQVLDGTAIVYEAFGKLYVNRPSGASSLDDDDILVTRTYTTQLCRMDTVRLVDRVARFERGFVSLNEFVPYEKPKKKS